MSALTCEDVGCDCVTKRPTAEVKMMCMNCGSSDPSDECNSSFGRNPCVMPKSPPAPTAEPQWLDAPDGPGHWFNCITDGVVFATTIEKDEDIPYYVTWACKHKPGCKWQRIPTPAPPAPSLPKSREVTLSAQVEGSERHGAVAFFLDKKQIDVVRDTRKECIDLARKWGVEPTVLGEE